MIVNEKIYPSMVIRNQAEAIKLLQQENQQLKAELELYKGSLKKEHEQVHRANDLEDRIDKAQKYLKDNRNTCFFDEDINYLLKILKGE